MPAAVTARKPADHLTVRTVIGQGRKKAKPLPITFNDSDYELPGKAPIGFIEAIAEAAAQDLSDERTSMTLLKAFLSHVVPANMIEDLRRNGDQDDLNELFETWNQAVKAGEPSGSSD